MASGFFVCACSGFLLVQKKIKNLVNALQQLLLYCFRRFRFARRLQRRAEISDFMMERQANGRSRGSGVLQLIQQCQHSRRREHCAKCQ
nr:MAG TPA: hypothetical protein [Caudoviricetes sp.]